ncbi:hypothetical protein [Streptomyces sp. NBC_00525]|uniref:hypothetical protein n=1 Tax=Streptomyces sp. NBC_00525 TaxID=2903660 RepID=UPI002E7FD775|nr:hypothetical protein [Streptomyces sp. NBC_00525]WUC96456.1 hypothetical protein OG710_23900 [Streptomyces sp. NBC_00525]
MEQRIDPKTQPAYAAGTDPAYIPGLTAPGPAATVAEEPEDTGEPAPADAVADAPADQAQPAAADEDNEQEESEESDEEAADGPSFEVSDRRGSIAADRKGVRFTLDDQRAEFGWDEIGAVEVKPARFGRRFTVTVHLSTRRWFNGEVEAASRGSLKEWGTELDAVLDAYFED